MQFYLSVSPNRQDYHTMLEVREGVTFGEEKEDSYCKYERDLWGSGDVLFLDGEDGYKAVFTLC